MENRSTPYFYQAQLTSTILHIMNAFGWIEVESGKNSNGEVERMSVPVHYGLKDRVAAAIIAGNTQNRVLRAPSMALYMTNIEPAPALYKSYGQEKTAVEFPLGGEFPADLRSRRSMAPVPYYLLFDLSILCSNLDQKHQIIEQIMVMFGNNFQIQLQKNDNLESSNRFLELELAGMTNEETYPPGPDRRMIIQTVQLRAIAYIGAPVQTHNNIIQTVKLRLATLDNIDAPTDFAVKNIEQYVLDADVLYSAEEDFKPEEHQ